MMWTERIITCSMFQIFVTNITFVEYMLNRAHPSPLPASLCPSLQLVAKSECDDTEMVEHIRELLNNMSREGEEEREAIDSTPREREEREAIDSTPRERGEREAIMDSATEERKVSYRTCKEGEEREAIMMTTKERGGEAESTAGDTSYEEEDSVVMDTR